MDFPQKHTFGHTFAHPGAFGHGFWFKKLWMLPNTDEQSILKTKIKLVVFYY